MEWTDVRDREPPQGRPLLLCTNWHLDKNSSDSPVRTLYLGEFTDEQGPKDHRTRFVTYQHVLLFNVQYWMEIEFPC